MGDGQRFDCENGLSANVDYQLSLKIFTTALWMGDDALEPVGFEAGYDRHLPGVPKIIRHRRLLHGRARANAKRASSIFTFACELTLDAISLACLCPPVAKQFSRII